MNEQTIVENGRIDYLRGVYIKPNPKQMPVSYQIYQDPYMQMWRDYDTGWNYEKHLLPDLHPNTESLYLLANTNFGNEDFRRDFKAGYRAFHSKIPIDSMTYSDYNKVVEGWEEAQYIAQRATAKL